MIALSTVFYHQVTIVVVAVQEGLPLAVPLTYIRYSFFLNISDYFIDTKCSFLLLSLIMVIAASVFLIFILLSSSIDEA